MSYDAKAAVAYAELFAKRVCHDGYVATSGRYAKFPPGQSHTVTISDEDDCTHFISCCVGQHHGQITVDWAIRHFRGGGIHLQSPMSHIYPGLFGEVTTPRAFGQLQIRGRGKIVEPRFMLKEAPATREAIRRNLRKGDIIAYAKDKHVHTDGTGNYQHVCIVIKIDPLKGPIVAGDTVVGIACHTIPRFGEDFVEIGAGPFVTLLKFP
jgi:hypothetical protein